MSPCKGTSGKCEASTIFAASSISQKISLDKPASSKPRSTPPIPANSPATFIVEAFFLEAPLRGLVISESIAEAQFFWRLSPSQRKHSTLSDSTRGCDEFGASGRCLDNAIERRLYYWQAAFSLASGLTPLSVPQ